MLGGIVALAAALRFTLIGQHSLWFDEAFVVWVTRLRWQEILPALRGMDNHPPLYYLLMKGWVSIAGRDEVALRVPSACFSTLCVPLTYALMRRTSREWVSLLGAFLVSVSPLGIMTGQEARMYPLLSALALGSTLAVAACAERGRAADWIVYVGLATAMIYTHHLGLFVLAAHGAWIILYERRHVVPWLWSLAVVVVLYTPWIPALWDQTHHVNTQLFGSMTYREPGDLLGLFAFGGSLFGMGTYFSSGPLKPIEQLIVLLPFLVTLWRGVVSLRTDRSGLALLGLPPAVTIGVVLVISLVKPAFNPRWFSFLAPFYAMFLARGIVDVAEGLRGQRDRSVALLTAGVLLYSMPVLTPYYANPAARPYQWRSAAALVKRQARPQDLLLYVGVEPKVVFTYYLQDPPPSLTLAAAPGSPGNPSLTVQQVRMLAGRFPRVWLVVTNPFTPVSPFVHEQLLPALDRGYRMIGGRDFDGIWIYLLEARPR
ncbi:MAG TPA: glycosyltransferase family 39 protein [bacterium]|nr:glycosyltransferase family 39 protein [bacterium]